MLTLTENLFINHGGMRRCYRHPENPGRCVKVYRRQGEIAQWMKRWRIWWGIRVPAFNINVQEYRFWQRLVTHPECGELMREYVPQMDGMVETNLGPGLMEELLTNDDGSPARNLFMLADDLTPEQWQKIDQQTRRLADCVVQHALPFYDWNPHNFLLVRRGESIKIMVADLEGELSNKELIKISRFSRLVRKDKLRRRSERFLNGWLAERLRQE